MEYKYQDVKRRRPQGIGWYQKDKKIFYLDLPKCASTSTKHPLKANDNFEFVNYFDVIKEVNKEDIFTFTIIRNPLIRYISAYVEALARGEWGMANKEFNKITHPKDRFIAYIDELHATLNKDPYSWDPHVRQMTFYMNNVDDPKNIIFINKYLIFKPSTLTKEFNVMCEFLNLNTRIPDKPQNKRDINKQYFIDIIAEDKSRLKKIFETYAEDIGLYNYLVPYESKLKI